MNRSWIKRTARAQNPKDRSALGFDRAGWEVKEFKKRNGKPSRVKLPRDAVGFVVVKSSGGAVRKKERVVALSPSLGILLYSSEDEVKIIHVDRVVNFRFKAPQLTMRYVTHDDGFSLKTSVFRFESPKALDKFVRIVRETRKTESYFTQPQVLPNEVFEEDTIKQVSLVYPTDYGEWIILWGDIQLSNYRLVFLLYKYDAAASLHGDIVLLKSGLAVPGILEIPLHSIQELELKDPSLDVKTKDLRTFQFMLDQPFELIDTLKARIRKKRARVYKEFTCMGEAMQTPVYSPQDEIKRFKALVPTAPIRLFDQGVAFQVCPSYPRFFIVPESFSDNDVAKSAEYRSRKRLPAVRWVHPGTKAVLLRSAQPMAGVLNNRSQLDEKLLFTFTQISEGKELYIVDARGRPAVVGNALQGRGIERKRNYTNTSIELCKIGNIHTMRNSLLALVSAITCTSSGEEESFQKKVSESLWLKHIQLMLAAAVNVVEHLELGASVLVHCSDGFDRTPQLICLAKIILDPYYRSIHGFCELLESEWCGFGHKFRDRTSDLSSQEYSPIFLQFLDATHDWLAIRGACFEFDERLLLFLAQHLHSARFGSFMFNCDKDRQEEGATKKTQSIWEFVVSNSKRFTNPAYVEFPHMVWPSFSPKAVHLWKRHFYRDLVHLLPLF
mmetsp:Transcript_11135/g.20690  ORF Transcript_11135/g.20690 Transcript_11135/m.20690 type:complete len:669 (-) Transcript_11135:1299-3305(-)